MRLAADLPVKARPVQYVKICSLYGAGFYYIPGTDTCIKVGGWVRAEYNINAGGSFNPYHTVTLDSRGKNLTNNRVRGIITMDTRSQTEYGTLRSYIAGGFQSTNDTAGEIYAPRAFIQWAGFTAGRAVSFFDFYVTPAYSNTTNILGSDTGGGGDTVFAYTAQMGNGLSATLSAEDAATRRTAIYGAGYIGTGATAFGGSNVGGYAGTEWPDVVGNLRIDQAWGSAQIMGAIHQVRGLTTGDEVGWAVGAGFKLNLPWAHGDSITTQFAYAKGALKYIGGGLTTMIIQDGTTEATGPAFDAVLNGTSLDLTEGWSVVAGADHHWNPMWTTSLYGGYSEINYSDTSSATLAGAGANADWKFWQIGSRTVWTPVQNLDLSIDVMYNNLDGASFTTAAGAGAGYTAGNNGWWQGIIRVQRNFWP